MVPGQSYEFRVRAIYNGITQIFGEGCYYGGAIGEGEWSDIKSITVPAAPAFGGAPWNPAAPLTYDPCGFPGEGCYPSYTYNLSWTAPTSGIPIYYEITSRVGNTGTYNLTGSVFSNSTTLKLYQATQFRIRAAYGVCSDGCSVTGYSDYVYLN
jgi:hypothetical protein